MSDKSILFMHDLGPQTASFRYRAQMPAEQVSRHNGFKTALNQDGEYDIVVVAKPTKGTVPIAEQAKKDGAKIVVDFSDDHFTDEHKAKYAAMAQIADHIVVASDVMRTRIQRYLDCDATVIPDPYEQPEFAPHADGDDYLWFGHQSNFQDLVPHLWMFKDRKLRVLTGPKELPHTTVWTPENMVKMFAQSNIAVFPTRSGAEFKSANRLLNTIRAGCFPICQQHPAYMEFRPFIWVGDMNTGLKWSAAFKQDLNDCVAAAQDYIRDRYSPETLGKKWADMLEGI